MCDVANPNCLRNQMFHLNVCKKKTSNYLCFGKLLKGGIGLHQYSMFLGSIIEILSRQTYFCFILDPFEGKFLKDYKILFRTT